MVSARVGAKMLRSVFPRLRLHHRLQSASPSMDDAEFADVWRQRCDVLYKARVQSRYHHCRQGYFEFVDGTITVLTICMALSLFSKTVQEHLPWVSFGVTVLAIIAVVFNTAEKKYKHKDLAAQASKLTADITAVPVRLLTSDLTAQWESEFGRLAGRCPPPKRTLTLMCEREQSISDGYPDHVAEQHWLRRMTSQFIT